MTEPLADKDQEIEALTEVVRELDHRDQLSTHGYCRRSPIEPSGLCNYLLFRAREAAAARSKLCCSPSN